MMLRIQSLLFINVCQRSELGRDGCLRLSGEPFCAIIKVKRKVSRDDEREEQEVRSQNRGYSKDLAQIRLPLSQHGLGGSLVDVLAK